MGKTTKALGAELMQGLDHDPGSIEGCECLACSEQYYREGYDSMLHERDRLWKALEFYANKNNYDLFGIPRIPHSCEVPDMGRTARVALTRAV
jgi:hypothetical protein